MSTIRRGLLIGSAILCGERATAQLTSCVSVNSSEVPGIGTSVRASISADGRYVVFGSAAANLAGPDANANWDAFVRDLQARTTECVSVDASGHAGNGASYTDLARAISQDGRFVVFRSDANDLVAGDTNGVTDVFVRDRQSGTTECASVDSGGVSANGASSDAAISADGRFVAFTSTATNLVPGTSIVARRVFLRDLQSGTTELVSVRIGGADADAESYGPSLSADGRFAAFTSWLPDLAAGDTNGRADVFVRDRQAGTTEIASLGDSGQLGNEDCLLATISPDGNFVAFESAAADLVPADTNGFMVDVFLRDRVAATTDLVSVSTSGAQGRSTPTGRPFRPTGGSSASRPTRS
jgi:Tol biopolymer transport system component